MPYPHSTAPVLLLDAGSQLNTRHCLERIAASHPIVLVDSSAPTWTTSHTARFLSADLRAPDLAAAKVKEFASERPVAGVMTYMDQHVELAARLAQDLGLPGMAPESALRCRDRAETWRLLAEHRVPTTRSYPADTEQDAVDYANLLRFPVVVKPRGLDASAGLWRAYSDAEVRAAYRAATSSSVLGLSAFAVTGCLVEEFVEGEEVSAETIVLGPERTSIVAITRKLLGPAPTVLEVGHVVRAHDPLVRDPAVMSVVRRAVETLGISCGLLHIRLRRPIGARASST
ncbi:acetyl-CoA carboxylase biotin carboxylase subunit family protein [Streptomyces sp. NPDC015127]|uniref:ATP-grasp domain-containing protein n=1 Tax=Streptomyces sp. NPDC015127 TaxID=3364939 RepID=UPI0036FBD2FA